MTDKEEDLINRFEKYIYNNPLSNECLVEIFKLICDYGNITNIKNYSKSNNITPQALYKSKKFHEYNRLKFIVDNESN